MRTEVLKRLAMIVWIAAGAVALAFAVLIGPNFFLPGVSSDRSTVYVTRPFELVDANGRTVTERDFRTKPTAWFLGFTHCPDMCPTTLADLTAVLDRLWPDADKINVVFVTVDPERDTPEVLKEYLSSFDPRIIGLTGSREAIDAMAKAYFVHQAKVP
jgi:protein SCO1/2